MYAKVTSLHIPVWARLSSKTLFFILATTLILIFVFYAYLVNRTIMNVVAREKTESTIANLSTSIGELEFKYLSLKNSVTIDLAYQKGFHDATPSQFIGRAGSVLSYNSR